MIHFLPQLYAAEKLPNIQGVASINSLIVLLKNTITGITIFAGIAILVILIISGFTVLFSGGDAKQLEKAKNSFTYAIIGLVVIISAYLILWLIQLLTGAKVTEFNLIIK